MNSNPSNLSIIPVIQSQLSYNLKIAAINVNSIITLNKRYDLLNFISNLKLDILLITETKLNSKHKLQFTDYHIIRNDRPGSLKGGGTAIIINKNIKFEKI